MLSRVLTRKEQYVLLLFAGSIFLGAAALLLTRDSSSPPGAAPIEVSVESPQENLPAAPHRESIPSPPEPASADPPSEAAPALAVAVRGAVRTPGVYTFQPGDRVQDAVDQAGGLEAGAADLRNINLAARLIDGTTLHIPERSTEPESQSRITNRRPSPSPVFNPPSYTLSGWRPDPEISGPSAPGGPSGSGAASGGININTASADELATLPGIGPVLSNNIVQHRQRQPFNTVDDLTEVNGIGAKRLETLRPLVTVQ